MLDSTVSWPFCYGILNVPGVNDNAIKTSIDVLYFEFSFLYFANASLLSFSCVRKMMPVSRLSVR